MATVLHLEFSAAISPELLEALRRPDFSLSKNSALAALLLSAGGERLAPVHELSPAELSEDRYGFAREFKLFLLAETDAEAAIPLLRGSSLIRRVEPVGIQRPFEDR